MMESLIIPPSLSAGDAIGIIAPARSVSAEELNPFMDYMERYGLKVIPGKHLFGRVNQFSGSTGERLDDLHSMISQPGVKAIFAARGGYGSAQLLPGININLLKDNPTWLIGFSDMTAIHSLVNHFMESIHAVMPYSMVMETPQDERSFSTLMNVLKGGDPEYVIEDHAFNFPGSIDGRITGGNLSVLYSLAGTRYEPDYEGKILFLEDLDEYLYHIDRMVLNFELREVFKKIGGLVIGEMSDMHDNAHPFGKTALEIIAERAHKYKVPTVFGFPAGHKKTNCPLIFGRPGTLTVEKGNCRIKTQS